MDKKEIEKYQEILEERRKKIRQAVENYEKPVDFGDDNDSLEEEADELEEKGNRLAIAQDLKKELEQINEALNKIEKGNYGICTKCGGLISNDVLEVAPESLLCEKCKKNK